MADDFRNLGYLLTIPIIQGLCPTSAPLKPHCEDLMTSIDPQTLNLLLADT